MAQLQDVQPVIDKTDELLRVSRDQLLRVQTGNDDLIARCRQSIETSRELIAECEALRKSRGWGGGS
jgi:hypothetical protein